MEKLLVTSNFSFSHSVYKRLVSKGCQNMSLCGNALTRAITKCDEYPPKSSLQNNSQAMLHRPPKSANRIISAGTKNRLTTVPYQTKEILRNVNPVSKMRRQTQ